MSESYREAVLDNVKSVELCQVFICVQRFETIGEYSGAFLEQVITTNFVTADDFFGQRNISLAEH